MPQDLTNQGIKAAGKGTLNKISDNMVARFFKRGFEILVLRNKKGAATAKDVSDALFTYGSSGLRVNDIKVNVLTDKEHEAVIAPKNITDNAKLEVKSTGANGKQTYYLQTESNKYVLTALKNQGKAVTIETSKGESCPLYSIVISQGKVEGDKKLDNLVVAIDNRDHLVTDLTPGKRIKANYSVPLKKVVALSYSKYYDASDRSENQISWARSIPRFLIVMSAEIITFVPKILTFVTLAFPAYIFREFSAGLLNKYKRLIAHDDSSSPKMKKFYLGAGKLAFKVSKIFEVGKFISLLSINEFAFVTNLLTSVALFEGGTRIGVAAKAIKAEAKFVSNDIQATFYDIPPQLKELPIEHGGYDTSNLETNGNNQNLVSKIKHEKKISKSDQKELEAELLENPEFKSATKGLNDTKIEKKDDTTESEGSAVDIKEVIARIRESQESEEHPHSKTEKGAVVTYELGDQGFSLRGAIHRVTDPIYGEKRMNDLIGK